MDSIIDINNLMFYYDDKKIIDNLTLEINQGDFVSIVGPNGSGKSTLVNILSGIYDYDATNITIDGLDLNHENNYEINKKIGIVFDNFYDQFIWDKVEDELVFSLENLDWPRDEIKMRVDEISYRLGIDSLLDKNINSLNFSEKKRLALATALIAEPKILILDDMFDMVDKTTKQELTCYLNELHNTTDITIINVTHDLDSAIDSDKIVIIKNGVIESMAYTMDILKDEKLLKANNLELPFPYALSLNLKYYALVDDMISDIEEMVVKIWQ